MSGASTDPRQTVERRLLVTRSILTALAKCTHPVSIITTGALIERDIGLLGDLACGSPTSVAMSLTTLDAAIERMLDLRAPRAGYVLLRLPYEVKDLFREWLAEHFPQRAAHVMSLVRDARGGRDDDPGFGTRMKGTGVHAKLLRNRFELACRRLGLNRAPPQALPSAHFRQPGPAAAQLQLGL